MLSVQPLTAHTASPEQALAPARSAPGWQARLELVFAPKQGATQLVRNRHEGPLRLIRALPLSDGRCQAVIVHPPGGLVGGDQLDLDIRLNDGAQVLCTTPGAQKWYRAVRGGARACTRITAGVASRIEWLPQPTLVYDAAQVDQSLDIELAPDARMIGWECLVLGRAAMEERFLHGFLRQSVSVSVAATPVWAERTAVAAGDRLFASPLGWGGRTVACTVWAVAASAQITDECREDWRSLIAQYVDSKAGQRVRFEGGVSRVAPGLMMARLLADDAETVMTVAQGLWACARPSVLGAGSAAPRIWAT